MYAAFRRDGAGGVGDSMKHDLTTEDLLKALSSTVPLSVTRAEEIGTLRDWAKDRAVWASGPEAKKENARP